MEKSKWFFLSLGLRWSMEKCIPPEVTYGGSMQESNPSKTLYLRSCSAKTTLRLIVRCLLSEEGSLPLGRAVLMGILLSKAGEVLVCCLFSLRTLQRTAFAAIPANLTMRSVMSISDFRTGANSCLCKRSMCTTFVRVSRAIVYICLLS